MAEGYVSSDWWLDSAAQSTIEQVLDGTDFTVEGFDTTTGWVLLNSGTVWMTADAVKTVLVDLAPMSKPGSTLVYQPDDDFWKARYVCLGDQSVREQAQIAGWADIDCVHQTVQQLNQAFPDCGFEAS